MCVYVCLFLLTYKLITLESPRAVAPPLPHTTSPPPTPSAESNAARIAPDPPMSPSSRTPACATHIPRSCRPGSSSSPLRTNRWHRPCSRLPPSITTSSCPPPGSSHHNPQIPWPLPCLCLNPNPRPASGWEVYHPTSRHWYVLDTMSPSSPTSMRPMRSRSTTYSKAVTATPQLFGANGPLDALIHAASERFDRKEKEKKETSYTSERAMRAPNVRAPCHQGGEMGD